eukprot:PhM_4_TR748/c0_g1_i1/m.43278/K14860/TMA16; translation machinery-associated protein 16
MPGKQCSVIGKVLTAHNHKSKKILHPNSRKAGQLSRKITHQERQTDIKSDRKGKDELLAEMVEWFCGYVKRNPPSKRCLDPAELQKASQQYVLRFDTDIIAARTTGKRNDYLELIRRELSGAYEEEGLVVPDMCTRQGFQWVVNYDGSIEQARKVPLTKVRYGEAPGPTLDDLLREIESGGHEAFQVGKAAKKKQKQGKTTQSLKKLDAVVQLENALERRRAMRDFDRKNARKAEVEKARNST